MSRAEYIERLLQAVIETEQREQAEKAAELFEYLTRAGYIRK